MSVEPRQDDSVRGTQGETCPRPGHQSAWGPQGRPNRLFLPEAGGGREESRNSRREGSVTAWSTPHLVRHSASAKYHPLSLPVPPILEISDFRGGDGYSKGRLLSPACAGHAGHVGEGRAQLVD